MIQANMRTGLQTPRLKRLAEIVSSQAIAQQEKLEFGVDDFEGPGELAEVDESAEIEVAA